MARLVQRDPGPESTLKQPLVLLIGAPLPPPYGGVARYIQLLLPALARKGFRARVVHPGRGPTPTLPSLPEGADVKTVMVEFPGAIRLIGWLVRRPRILGTLLRWYAKALLRAPRFAVRELAMTACLIRSSEGLLDDERPDIVHGFDTPWSYGAATLILARERNAKSVFSFFGDVLPHEGELEHFEAAGRSFAPASRAVLEGVDIAASMTNHCRELVRSLGLSPDGVALIRVIGDMDPFNPGVDGEPIRARHGGTDPILLFVGHLRARKGPQVLVEALPAIRARHPQARAVFVGPDYGNRDELVSLASRLEVEDAVDIVGVVGDDELPSYYAAADVFVFPTTTTIECLGLSFVQAMFAGVPVVATKIAGAPEVIRDGIDGRLVEPEASTLAEGISEVLGLPPDERRALGQRGRARAGELFEKQAVLDDLLRSYDGLLSRG